MVRCLPLLGAVALVLAGCGQKIDERAADLLQENVDGAHEHFVDIRARDPEPTGQAMLDQLDPWGYALEARVGGDDVHLLWGVSATVSETEGWIEPTTTAVSLGACLAVAVRAGDGGGDRGSVWTEPVPCPDGAEIVGTGGYPAVVVGDGNPADRFTTDVDGHRDDVGPKPHDRSVCLSGEDCTEGGG